MSLSSLQDTRKSHKNQSINHTYTHTSNKQLEIKGLKNVPFTISPKNTVLRDKSNKTCAGSV